ncbi:MAG: hypothetical protein R2810_07595 [Flavobacteriales bacterium]|nr:O-antigen ligase family protein [Flavobacteriales bacterium]MCB0783049.1 O-antigen ligase family protein [Flavobacteriales bacterium]MCB0807701.1 O-antigen ligase family protein [Flavobacteriales bacterium]MCB0811949.1 O-antigen ligase family protein [Flavobacteriales bacterium]MCB0816117.1 O-antigen ligase family protein [Flavobacteriales bacterium]
MIRKKALVNTLFLVGFTVFGFGSYISLKRGLSEGMIVSVMPFLAIIAFFLVDSVYRERIRSMLTGTYWLSMLYIGTLVVSMFVALRGGIPGVNFGNALLSSLLFAAPFNAAVIVQYYNRDDDDFDFSRMLLLGLGMLMAVNVLGYAAGIKAFGHGFEGRASFPFIRGIYTGAHVLAVLSLMLLFHLRDPLGRPVRYFMVVASLAVAFVLMLSINSRLSLMIFLLLAIMILTRAIKVARGIYTISLFTMPLLLSFSLLVYQVLSLPFFEAILQRVSKEDVTTFNGRSYIWNAVADWAFNDRTGLLFGNGFKGHYKLHMLDLVAKLWGEPHAYNLHSHSTFTEVLVAQGVFGVVLLYILLWRGFKYYRNCYLRGSSEAPIFGGLVYILFIWQIDIFCYGVDIGHAILFTMLAPLAIDRKFIGRKEKDMDGAWLE